MEGFVLYINKVRTFQRYTTTTAQIGENFFYIPAG